MDLSYGQIEVFKQRKENLGEEGLKCTSSVCLLYLFELTVADDNVFDFSYDNFGFIFVILLWKIYFHSWRAQFKDSKTQHDSFE